MVTPCAALWYLLRARFCVTTLADEITYRKANAADAEGIARVQVGSWRESYRGVVAQELLDSLSVERRTEVYRVRLSEPGAGFYELFVAEHEGQIVGICDVGEPRAAEFGCAGELYMIYLLKSYQRRGIGRRLFRRALELLVASGRNSMYLECLEHNPYRGFYEQLGGELCGHSAFERLGREYKTLIYRWTDLAQTLRQLTGRAG
jgi:GNAT superfamily N-acetyltransferase